MAFAEDLNRLVRKEMAAARSAQDDERGAGVVADLASELGAAIAILCEGDAKGIELLLTGADQLVQETAAEQAPAARLIGQMVKAARHA